MSGHPQWKLLTCALLSALIGCQSSGKPALPWLASKGTNKTNHSNAERGDLKPAVAEERFASNTSQSDSEPTPAVSSEKVAQLIREGQALLQKADSNDPHSAQLEEARQLLSEAVQLSPNSHQAHHSLAIIADLQKDWKAAEEHYKQALSQRPQDASLLNDLGYSYVLQNRFHDASQFLNRAIEVNPNHEHARYNLALLALKQGDRQGALSQLSQLNTPAEAQQMLASLEADLNKDKTPQNSSTADVPRIPANASFEQAIQMAAEVGRRERQQREQQSLQTSQSDNLQQWPPSAAALANPRTGRPQQAQTSLGNPSGQQFAQQMPAGSQFAGAGQQPGMMPGANTGAMVSQMPQAFPLLTPQNQSPQTMNQMSPSAAAGLPGQMQNSAMVPQMATQAAQNQVMSPAAVGRPVGGILSIHSTGQGQGLPQTAPAGNPYQSISSGGSVPQNTGSSQIHQTAHNQFSNFQSAPTTNAMGLVQSVSPAAVRQTVPRNYGVQGVGQQGLAQPGSALPGQAPIAGLNTGPDSLFPISSGNRSNVPMNPGTGNSMPADHSTIQQFVPGQNVPMPQQQTQPTGAAPSTRSVINGAMFEQARSYLPAEQALPAGGSGQFGTIPPQSSFTPAASDPRMTAALGQTSYPTASAAQTPAAYSGLPAGWPASGTGTSGNMQRQNTTAPDPLAEYEVQLQNHNNTFNQALQQMSPQNSAVNAVQARY